jgi:hypothetical protein
MRQNGDLYAAQHVMQGSPVNSTIAETYPRLMPHSNVAIAATGVELSVPITLQFGDVVTSITFVTATTAAGTPTAGYACLRDSAGALLGQTADFGSTARAANTAFKVSLATPYLVTQAGLFYLGLSFTASTVPTVFGLALSNAVMAGAVVTGFPVLARTHGSSVGATAPATTATPTTTANVPYLVVS